jgi:hypothetical protein
VTDFTVVRQRKGIDTFLQCEMSLMAPPVTCRNAAIR